MNVSTDGIGMSMLKNYYLYDRKFSLLSMQYTNTLVSPKSEGDPDYSICTALL